MNQIRFWNFNSHVEFEMRAWNVSCLRFWFRNGNYASFTTKACCHTYSRLWKLSDINFWKLICMRKQKKWIVHTSLSNLRPEIILWFVWGSLNHLIDLAAAEHPIAWAEYECPCKRALSYSQKQINVSSFCIQSRL